MSWPPTKASEGGVIVRAITKDPELLMVPAMIDPSSKSRKMENVPGKYYDCKITVENSTVGP